MQNKLKPIYTFLVIAVFLLIALATDSLPQESTNETVKISNCEAKPVVQGKLHIVVQSDLPNHYGMIFITQQKVVPDSCTFNVITNYRVGFNCDDQGHYVYDEDDMWTHDNSEDLWRVEVAMRAGQSHGTDYFSRDVQVQKYSQSNFIFNIVHRNGL